MKYTVRVAMFSWLLVGLSACGGGSSSLEQAADQDTPVSSQDTSTPSQDTSTPSQDTSTPSQDTSTPSQDTPAFSVATIQGVAATGAPMADADVLITDAKGEKVCQQKTRADGFYSCEVKLAAATPLVVSASKDGETHYAPLANLSSGRLNVTNLTTVIAAQLSASGRPWELANEVRAGDVTFDAQDVLVKSTELRDALKPVLVNASGDIDFLTGAFDANGEGHDRVLSALDVLIKPTISSSNISITLKTEIEFDQALPAINFVSGTTPPLMDAAAEQAPLPQVDEDDVLADLMTRLSACYALPVDERVSGDDVVAPICLGLFWNEDPSTFLESGSRVGPTGAFKGMFAESTTGVVFSSPVVEFRYAEDELRLRFDARSSDGVTSVVRLHVKRSDGQVFAFGNQYQYSFVVRPWTESRSLINRPELSYYSSGFTVDVPNIVRNGQPIFEKAWVYPPPTVTAKATALGLPGLFPLELTPSSSLSFLAIRTDGIQLPTNNVRLAGAFKDATTSGRPSRLTALGSSSSGENLFWLKSPESNSDWSDDEIDRIPELTRWKVVLFPASGGEPVTQYYETLVAPLTVEELRAGQWASLDSKTMTDFLAKTAVTRYIDLSGLSKYEMSWDVPPGAHAPRTIQIWGRDDGGYRGVQFNDVTSVPSSSRSGDVTCSAQSSSDNHCDVNGNYAVGAAAIGLNLFVADEREMTWAAQHFSYTLPGF